MSVYKCSCGVPFPIPASHVCSNVPQPPSGYVRMLTSSEIDTLVRDGLMTEDSARGLIKRAAYKVLEVNGLRLESAFPKKAEASPAEEGRDAARYRELRRLSMLKGWWPKEVAAVLADTRGTHAEFDAAVDAAITATKEPKNGR